MSKQGSVKTIQIVYAATFSGRCPNVYTSSVREQDELSQTAHTHPLKGILMLQRPKERFLVSKTLNSNEQFRLLGELYQIASQWK